MRTHLLTFFLLFTAFAYGQKYKPSVVILDPYDRKYDSVLIKEIQEFDFHGQTTAEDEKKLHERIKNEPKNIRKMEIEEMRFREKRDFASTFTLSLAGMIGYMIFGETDKALVIPSHETSTGQIAELKALAKKNDVQWIINPLMIKTYLKDNKKYTAVRLQVYDNKEEQIVLDKEYIGDTKNPGLELSCPQGTLNCTINNVLNVSLDDILLLILKRYQH
jgi:hypothetical protein